ncbi:MAG: site-specific DNA-methyltransferase [Clostridia bacterium]
MAQTVLCSRELHDVGGGRFILGHDELLCADLRNEYAGRVQLIYLDPPFGTGDRFSMDAGDSTRIPTYDDTLDFDSYMALMRTVLTACQAMLAPSGSIYLHIDQRMGAHLRLMMDDIFGEANFLNEIIWAYKSGGRAKKHYSRKHDTILFYRKSPSVYFNIAAVGVPRGASRRNHMKRTLDADGRVCYSIKSGGKTYMYYEDSPIYPSDVWDDIEHLHQRDPERTGYNTQKPEALLQRIILASSRAGDLVMDLFSGSGTTAVVADKLGRSWVATDSSAQALLSLRARILKAHSTPTLFSGSNPMCLEYPNAPGSDIDADIDIVLSNGLVSATVRACNVSLAYIALGYLSNHDFVPLAYNAKPQEGAYLTATVMYAPPVVQICDIHGNTRFIEYC